MRIKILTLVTLWTFISCVRSLKYECSERSALQLSKHRAHVFSMQLLRRVAEDTDGHFVFSPLSTWMELIALAENAGSRTLREIWRVTRHQRNRCMQRQLLQIFKRLDWDLSSDGSRMSLMVVDKYMNVKPKFKRSLQKLYGVKLMEVNFDDPEYSAALVNKAVWETTDGVINRTLYDSDFTSSVLLLSDVGYFKTEWRSPFDSAVTKIQQFYSNDPSNKSPVYVSMMNQVGYFNLIDFPKLRSTILELPCAIGRISMLVFLPYPGVWPGNLFFDMQNITIASIFNEIKKQGTKSVNVHLPKFKIRSEIDNIPELITDMGIKRIFYPKSAELYEISRYTLVHASLMTQVSYIEVTEKGVTALTSASSLIRNTKDSVDFVADRPFSYMLIDKNTQFILYAGTYSVPTVI